MKTVLSIYAYYGHIWQIVESIGVMGTRLAIRTRAIVVPEPYQGPLDSWEYGDPYPNHRRDIDGARERPVR